MRMLCTLTDRAVLGVDHGFSLAKPRLTARAILRDRQNRYAVAYERKFHLYVLPGGGLEEGETPLEALKREVLEETGCLCDEATELGKICENRAHQDYTVVSHFYVVTTNGPVQTQQLTAKEKDDGIELQWHTLQEVMDLIGTSARETKQQKFLQARDMAALRAYMLGTTSDAPSKSRPIQLVRAVPKDAPLIQTLQQLAFSPLLETYQDSATNPACSPIEHIQAKLEQPFTYYYLIERDGQILGGIRVVDRKNGERKRISPLFVLPDYQNCGVAQAAVRAVEELHGAAHWSLGTIAQEAKNCHLYEKLGYRRTGESKTINSHMTIVFYEK